MFCSHALHSVEHCHGGAAFHPVVSKLKNLPGVTFDSASCAIVVDKEEFKHHLMVSFAYHFFVQYIQTTMVHSTNPMSCHG
jgi:hypothetical protein